MKRQCTNCGHYNDGCDISAMLKCRYSRNVEYYKIPNEKTTTHYLCSRPKDAVEVSKPSPNSRYTKSRYDYAKVEYRGRKVIEMGIHELREAVCELGSALLVFIGRDIV